MGNFKIVVHEAEEGGFWAEVEGLPGCVSEGETLEEVKANIVDAAAGCIASSMDWYLARAGERRVGQNREYSGRLQRRRHPQAARI